MTPYAAIAVALLGASLTAPHSLATGLRRLCAWLAAAHERQRQRQRLAELDDRALADIGLSRAQARFEADKPFWRP